MTVFYPGWADKEPIPEGDDDEQRVRARGGKPFAMLPRHEYLKRAQRGGNRGGQKERRPLSRALGEVDE